jgi:hypothetical protein
MDRMTKFDKMAWKIIKDRKPSTRTAMAGLRHSGRPKNFAELAEAITPRFPFEMAFNSFLDEFYLYRSPDFFEQEPGPEFSIPQRAMLAATAEFLSTEFGLARPEWVNKPEYTLSTWYDPYDFGLDEQSSNPTFAKHGVLFQTKSLIRL